MKQRSESTKLLLKSVIKGILNKQGHDVLKIDLRKIENRIADYFVICHGTSISQVDAICDSVEDIVSIDAGEDPLHVEGFGNCYCVLVDYGDVVVHIFLEQYRKFYSLETLWADASFEEITDKIK